MNTERLTAEDVLNKHDDRVQVYYKKALSAMEAYATQETEHKTKQLKDEIDILKLALRRMMAYLDKGKAPYPGSFVYEDTKKVLNKLNQINEN